MCLASQKKITHRICLREEALSFLEGVKTPFFLFLSYTIPHANNEAIQFGEHGMEVPEYGAYRDKDWPEPEKGKATMIS